MPKKEPVPRRGRPKGSGYFDTAINVRMPMQLRKRVEEYGRGREFKVVSDAARELIELALDSAKGRRP